MNATCTPQDSSRDTKYANKSTLDYSQTSTSDALLSRADADEFDKSCGNNFNTTLIRTRIVVRRHGHAALITTPAEKTDQIPSGANLPMPQQCHRNSESTPEISRITTARVI